MAKMEIHGRNKILIQGEIRTCDFKKPLDEEKMD